MVKKGRKLKREIDNRGVVKGEERGGKEKEGRKRERKEERESRKKHVTWGI